MSTKLTLPKSTDSSLLPQFSHLYVESDVWDHPLTTAVSQRFPKSVRVPIERYTELTQQRSAVWGVQKRSPKLVLAKKRTGLLYEVGDVAPSFGHANFYYSVPMQNCLYDCEYCYLQGMYTSAHLVIFVNQGELHQAAWNKAEELGDLYLCIAYDNDLLAFEGIVPLVRGWVDALRKQPKATLEVRTKSANARALAEVEPASNVLLAWTLSPASVVRRFEAKTPPLTARLQALEAALDQGWRVRLCFDPLLPVDRWKTDYQGLLEELDARKLWERIEDVSYGLFRMNRDYLRQARKARPDSVLLRNATLREERGLFTLAQEQQSELLQWFGNELRQRLAPEQVWQT